MHHLHPKSSATSTLFTATLAVSFLVVGLPHILPCPVDRRQFADSVEGPDGQPRRRRRRNADNETGDSAVENATERSPRECPVPKPSGLVGHMMGFEQKTKERPVDVVVRSVRARKEEGKGDRERETP